MTEFINVDGKKLETCFYGQYHKEAPTLVLLHEGLGCVDLWKDFPSRVQEETGLNVFAYSRAGYGRSDQVDLPRPLTYMHHEGLSVLPQVLDAAGLSNVVLLGHSDGGSIALINAGGVNDPRVRGVMTMAAHVFNEDICVENIEYAKKFYETGNLREGLKRYHGDNVDNAFLGWNGAWLDPGFLEWNLEEFLPKIKVPTMVIQGIDDEYGTLRQVDAICNQVGGATEKLVLDACKHSPHKDQPDAIIKSIKQFTSQVWDNSQSFKSA